MDIIAGYIGGYILITLAGFVVGFLLVTFLMFKRDR